MSLIGSSFGLSRIYVILIYFMYWIPPSSNIIQNSFYVWTKFYYKECSRKCHNTTTTSVCVTIGNWIWANLKQKRRGKQWKGCILKDIWSVKRHQKGIEKGNFLHLKMDLNPILRQSETKIYKASNCEKAFNVMEEKVLTSLP